MQAAVLSPPVEATPQVLSHSNIGELVEACIGQTAEALAQTRAACQGDVLDAVETVRKAHAQGRPQDLMAAVALLQGQDEPDLGALVEALGNRVASTLNPSPHLIPFAGRLIAPSGFYESFEQIHKLARALLVPVIFAEEAGSIGVGSVNPIAGAILAWKIQELVARRFDIRPFVTVTRLDYESWTYLTHRHFEL